MNDERFKTMPVALAEGAGKPASWWGGSKLPSYLEAKHCKRVANFALMVSALVAIVVLVDYFIIADDNARSGNRLTQAIVFGMSAVLFLVARYHRFSHSLVLKLSLVYEVLLCVILSVGAQLFSASAQGIFATMTLTCVVIAIFPLIVPTPPLQTFFAALASAATGPLALTVVDRLGILTPRLDEYLVVSIFHIISVVVAVYGSRLIYGLNRDVAEARELGSYRLEESLGKGGMGEVWRARHQLLARPAAIKLVRMDSSLSSRAATDQLMQRFELEAQVTASLTSPHTVGLFDFGLNDEGTFYYVMELLDGLDLDILVDKYGPLRAERVVHILTQVCKSLAEAHDSGLVHRDIKPANLMICRYGREFDFVKVLDFGLVTLGSERSVDSRLTSEGLAAGTPGFMPPELATGDQADGRTDIYSLGCVAFWLLTGRLVFEGASPMEMIVAHTKKPPPRPSDCTEIEIPPALDDIVLECLEKDPARRPQSADALIEKLEACEIAGQWTPARSQQWWETHRPPTLPVTATSAE
jgi:eukaryotic-like serine/threonine-protein kinase